MKNFRKIFIIGILLFLCVKVKADVNIVPLPTRVKEMAGEYILPHKFSIGYNNIHLRSAAKYLKEKMAPSTGYKVKVKEGFGDISLVVLTSHFSKEESYMLKVNSKGVQIIATSYRGIINGISSLRQLLPNEIESNTVVTGKTWTIPAVDIFDQPNFEWRGLMLDPVRHFYTLDETKCFLDIMALYKFNKFHWHLTDNDGWRIEIKKYPLLTKLGAWRDTTGNYIDKGCEARAVKWNDSSMHLPHFNFKTIKDKLLYGGFYTQKEIKEIVKYAAVRGIDVIPELDMPGHNMIATKCYPWLSCNGDGHDPLCLGNDSVLKYCKNVFSEVFKLFPYNYTEIGGDEVNRTRWTHCVKCQARIDKEKLKDVTELQSWFTREMEKFFNAHGKRLVGWDEILEGGVSKTATVNWWRGNHTDVVQRSTDGGNEVILCPTTFCYFDFGQNNNTIQDIYKGNIVPTNLTTAQLKLVKGIQANIWGEWIPTEARMQYMVFPRALAMSEKAWTPSSQQSWKNFSKRLNEQIKRLNVLHINYRPLNSDATSGFNNRF